MTAVSNANMAQIKAAQPSSSTWVSANAGSGKTKVLIDRVTRLLLNQTQPQHILCLTYTKAAASHMQNKLFERLGKWSMLSDQHLLIELKTLGEEGKKLNLEKLIQARQLFARALDAPGGLKIQTIHSFCASILRRFPLEAGISPHFIELDERNIKLLQQEVLDDMAINDISGIFSKASFLLQTHEPNSFLDEIAKYRDLFNKTYNKLLDTKNFREIFKEVFIPFLEHVGLLWQTETILPVHEHFISNLITQKIQINTDELKHQQISNENVYILFLPENEIHELGLLYLNYELILRGHRTIYLGQSLPLNNLNIFFDIHDKISFVTSMTVRPYEDDIVDYFDTLDSIISTTSHTLIAIGKKVMQFSSKNFKSQISLYPSISELLKEI